jgi:hypothetical protein
MSGEAQPTPDEMMKAIMSRPTVPLWPHAGWAHNLSRGGTYQAANRGEIATIKLGRKRPALTGPLRKKLQMES